MKPEFFFAQVILLLALVLCLSDAAGAEDRIVVGLYLTSHQSFLDTDYRQIEYEYQSDVLHTNGGEIAKVLFRTLQFKNWECRWHIIDSSANELLLEDETFTADRQKTYRLKCFLHLKDDYFHRRMKAGKEIHPATPVEPLFFSQEQQNAFRPEVLLVLVSGLEVKPKHPTPSFLSRLFGAHTPKRMTGTSIVPTNVVMFMIDTLRSDHSPPYDHPFILAPHMDMLSALGIVFTRSYGASSSTRPSVGSMFSGLQPKAHGAVRHTTVGAFIHDGVPLLAEHFLANGFSTAGVSSNGQIIKAFGFHRGFQTFESPVWENQVTPFGLDQLKKIDEPFFMYLHYMAPHWPYEPPEPLNELYQGLTPYPEQDAYCAEITLDDRRIGEVLKELARQGLLNRTLIWLVSDHGEEFWEHGWKHHGVTLYEESVRTVSIFSYSPRFEMGNEIDLPVTHVDMFPTLTELMGWEPPQFFQGKSLLSVLKGQTDKELIERPIFLHHGGGIHLGPHFSDKDGIVMNGKKLIWWNQKNEWELYDLTKDSGEQENLLSVGKKPLNEDLETQRKKMETLLKKHIHTSLQIGKLYEMPEEMMKTIDLTQRELENLRRLGYIK